DHQAQQHECRGAEQRRHDKPDVVGSEDLVQLQAWLTDLRQGVKRGPIEQHITRPDGVRRLLRVEGQAIAGEDGAVNRIVGTSQDITEKQQMEQQLAHAMKMEALGTLTGGIAHDFNNVLSIVINNLEVTQQDLPPGHPTQEWLRDALDGFAGRRPDAEPAGLRPPPAAEV
ncbi:MAG: PAS domain S-box protein, partial [Rhodopila sp.]